MEKREYVSTLHGRRPYILDDGVVQSVKKFALDAGVVQSVLKRLYRGRIDGAVTLTCVCMYEDSFLRMTALTM